MGRREDKRGQEGARGEYEKSCKPVIRWVDIQRGLGKEADEHK